MPHITFTEEIKPAQINVPRAALSFAREIAYPSLDIQAYLSQLDDLAEAAGERVPPGGTAAERAEGLADFLFVQLGFRGNSTEYTDPRNSYLNEVLDRRLGIPDAPDSIARRGSNIYVTLRFAGQLARIKTQSGRVDYIDVVSPATTGWAIHGIAIRP